MVLGIYGFGGLGREVLIIASKINKINNLWSKIFFIDDNPELKSDKYTVYTFNDAKTEYGNTLEAVIAVGNPATRELLYNKVKAAGINIATLIHPGIYIDDTTSIEEGVIICEGVTVTCNVTIGADTYIHPHAVIGHDVKIGKHSSIGANSEIGGADVIGERFYIGFNAGTKELITIGNDVICSAGAIVFRDLPDEVIAVGNPARIMKKNEDKQVFGKSVNKG